jgi:hypothetical protein
MKPGASDGYYAAMSSIVAADAETRSAQITGRYAAMASAVNSISQSVVQGMQAAASYDLQSRKLQMDQEVAHYQIEAAKKDMELKSLQVQSENQAKEQRNQLFALDIQRRKVETAIGVVLTRYTTEMPGVVAEVAQLGPDEAKAYVDNFNSGIQRRLAEIEIGHPGAHSAFQSNALVLQHQQNLNSVVANKMVSETFNGVAYADAKMLMGSPDADKHLRLQAALAIVSSPRSARYPELMTTAKGVVAAAKEDPVLAPAAISAELRYTNPRAAARYDLLIASGVEEPEALASVLASQKRSESTVSQVLGLQGVEAEEAGVVQPTVQAAGTLRALVRAGDSAWSAAAGRVESEGLLQGAPSAAGNERQLATRKIEVVGPAVRGYYDSLVNKLVGAASSSEFAQAKQDLLAFTSSPRSKAEAMIRGGFISDRDVPDGVRSALKDGGQAWLPAELQTADFDALAKGIGNTTSSFGSEEANKVFLYNVTTEGAKIGNTVAELVIREQSRRFRPAADVLKDLRDRGLIAGYETSRLSRVDLMPARATEAGGPVTSAPALPAATGKPPAAP